ncbi:hypothetical protein T492DRAFT_835545 [Pavlovales sp. CCMP2436]|nr:hypothetical protein T492DRAFT_835545 [Pavlovales sp. CCMP2436]
MTEATALADAPATAAATPTAAASTARATDAADIIDAEVGTMVAVGSMSGADASAGAGVAVGDEAGAGLGAVVTTPAGVGCALIAPPRERPATKPARQAFAAAAAAIPLAELAALNVLPLAEGVRLGLRIKNVATLDEIVMHRKHGRAANRGRRKSSAGGGDEESEQISEDEEDEIETCCAQCGGSDDDARLLLCDTCNEAYHTFCLWEPLSDAQIPDGDWHCEDCRMSVGVGTAKIAGLRMRPLATAVLVADFLVASEASRYEQSCWPCDLGKALVAFSQTGGISPNLGMQVGSKAGGELTVAGGVGVFRVTVAGGGGVEEC